MFRQELFIIIFSVHYFILPVVTLSSNLPSNSQEETLENKFRDFVITPNMVVAPISRTPVTTEDILPTALSWSDNVTHIKRVIGEMKGKERVATDDLADDLEIISLSPKLVITVVL